MERTASPGSAMMSGTSTPTKIQEAAGYLLLTIQNTVVKQVFDGETMILARGEMRLECISLPIPPEVGKQTANPFAPSDTDPSIPTNDFWLVLHCGETFESPLIPAQHCTPEPQSLEGISYTFPSQSTQGATMTLTFPIPASNAELEDLDSFEVLLRQYGCLSGDNTALKDLDNPLLKGTAPVGEELRGRLVLINEDSGEVVGELDQQLDVVEDTRIAEGSKDKPVVLDFGNVIDGYAPKVEVKSVPEDELDDWILKGAHFLSKGILGFGSQASKTIQGGADLFIRNTKAAEKPVVLGKTTKAGIRMTHNATVRTVHVAKGTIGKINSALQKVAEKTYSTTVEPAVGFYKASEARRQSIQEENFKHAPHLEPDAQPMFVSPKAFALTGAEPPSYTPKLRPRKGSVPFANSPLSSLPTTTDGGEAPTIPPKPAGIVPAPTKINDTEAIDHRGEKIPIPSQTDTLLAEETALLAESEKPATAQSSARRSSTPSSSLPAAPAPPAGKKRPFINRLLLAGEVVLTSLEATAQDLINSGTSAASSAAGHKFGPEAGKATALLGGSVRNVAVVYIDVRGIGRRALLEGTAKGFVKAKLKSGETVQLQTGGKVSTDGTEVEAGEAEKGKDGETVVIGMQSVKGSAEQGVVVSPNSNRAIEGKSASSQGLFAVDQETLNMLNKPSR